MFSVVRIDTLVILFLSLWGLQSSAQKGIEADYDEKIGLYIIHQVDHGQTLYAISRNYGIPIHSMITANDIASVEDIPVGTQLRIPIRKALKRTPTASSTTISYRIKPKETLYGIAKRYLNIDPELLRELNTMTVSSLSIDELIIIGYLDNSGQNNSLSEETPSLVYHKSTSSEKPIGSIDTIEKKEIEELPTLSPSSKVLRGVALTTHTGAHTDGLLVIHPSAKVNSEIILYNPMMKKAVHATVIGKLNENTYDHSISVVISPAVAEALGALDRKFWVEMSYIE